jgi:hypothetical protein
MAIPVTVDNFVRAETDRTLASIQADAGGVGQTLDGSPIE